MAPAEAEQLGGRVSAWRTPLRPAMPDDAADPYRADGRSYGPRHGPFRSVDELRLVIGMTDELQRDLAPLLTIYSRAGEVDRQVATAAVLGALAEMGDRLAASQRDARENGQAAGVERAPAMGEAVRISARVEAGDVMTVRTAVVRLTGDRREPYWVLAWR
jgi:general secretion pathway protein K